MGFGYLGRSPIKIVEKETLQKGIYPIGDDCRPIGDVIVPEGPTSLNYIVFKDNESILSVMLPKSLVSLYPSAFENCISLKSVNFSNDIKDISERCFYKDKKLNVFISPVYLEKISKEAFYQCEDLKELKTPENDFFVSIGDYSFFEAKNLKDVDIYSKNLAYIGESAFENCILLKNFSFNSKDILEINSNAFKNTLLDSNIISKLAQNIDKEHIHEKAFSGLNNLKWVITKATTDYYFLDCINLEEAVIQDLNNEKRMGQHVFSNCPNLQKCTIPEIATVLDDYLFKDNTGLRIVNIPKQLQKIGNHTFDNCPSLNCEIELPNTLTTLGSYAFSGCKQLNLKDGLIPSSVTTIDTYCFSNALGDEYNLFNTETLNIDNTQQSVYINQYAFQNSGFKTINFLGEQPVYLDAYAFNNAKVNNINFISDIPILYFQKNVNSSNAAKNSAGIFKGSLLSNQAVENIIEHLAPLTPNNSWIPNHLFQGITAENISIPWAYCGYMFTDSQLKTVTFREPKNHETLFQSQIGYRAFSNCSSLEKVDISSNISLIDEYAFENCAYLREINIDPNGDNFRLKNYCFYYCSSLKKMICPTRVNSYDGLVWYYTNLEELFVFNKTPSSTSNTLSNIQTACTVYYTGNVLKGSSSNMTFKKVELLNDNICWWFTKTVTLNLEGIGATIDYTDSLQEKLDIINETLETPRTQDDYIISIVTTLPTTDISETTIYRIKDTSNIFYTDYILFENVLTEVRTVPTFDKSLVHWLYVREGRITSLGHQVFKDCPNLKFAEIFDTVTEIKEDTFENAPEDFHIICNKGSYAYYYALSMSLKYILTNRFTIKDSYTYENPPPFVDGTNFVVDDSWKCIRSNIDATTSGLAQATHTFTTENMPEKYSFSGCCSATSNDYGGIYISTVPHTFTRAEITSGATPDGGFWLYRNNGYGAPVTKVSERWLEPNTAYHVHFVYSKYSSSFANQNALVINNICRHVYLEGE